MTFSSFPGRMDAELFELLDQLAQYARGSNKRFGGIQIALCGDFFQVCSG